MHVKHESLIFLGVTKYPADNCLCKFDIKNVRIRCQIFSKLTIKTPELFFFEHVFVCCVVTFIFVVWMIFIILVIFIAFMISKKTGVWCTF